MQTIAFRKHALVPKPRTPVRYVPACHYPESVRFDLGRITPKERQLLTAIAETADLIQVDKRLYILAPVTVSQIETLAVVGADLEDRELDIHDEENGDDEPDHDRELDQADDERESVV